MAPWRLLLAACALGALVVPLAMHWIDWAIARDALAGRPLDTAQAGASVWEQVGLTAWLRDTWNLPWWVAAWGLAAAFPPAVGLLVLVFDDALRALRVDPERHSAAALRWALSAWRIALLPFVLLVAVAAVSWALREPMWALAVVYALPIVMGVAVPFFTWSPAYVAAEHPTARIRFRWPGAPPALAWAVCWLLSWLVATLVLRLADASPAWSAAAMFAILVPLWLCVGLFAQLFWFNAAALGTAPALRHAAREALRWRAIGAVLGLELRLYGVLIALLLPMLPAGLLMLWIFPSLEPLVAAIPPPTALQPMIDASRVIVAWWWAAAMIGWTVVDLLVLAWLHPLASGRLVHELGLVAPHAAPARATTAPRATGD